MSQNRTLDSFMEKQRLHQYLESVAEDLTANLAEAGRSELCCCFTGHRSKKVPWLADNDDYRNKRLRDTLTTLVNSLSLHGVQHYIAGNADGFDTISAESVLKSNEYLKVQKERHIVPESWNPSELEIAIPFEGHNSNDQRCVDVQKKATLAHVVSNQKSHAKAFHERNGYMVDNADIVIAFLDDSNGLESGGSVRTAAYALRQGKLMITLFARWFEDGWPDIKGISVAFPQTD